MTREKLIAVYYEHPDWFRSLFAELDRRGTPYVRLDARCHRYDAGARGSEYALFFNRMSAAAYLRGHGNAIFYTRNYLAHLERTSTRVVNGSDAFAIETSKALQLNLLASLKLLLQCSPQLEEMERFAENVISPRAVPATARRRQIARCRQL